MAKSTNLKTNGHTVAALKPAAPKKPATGAAAKDAAKPAVKAAGKPAPKPSVKSAAKVAVTPAAKSAKAAATTATAKKAAAKPAAPAVKSARKAAAPASPAVKPAAKPATKPVAKPAAPKASAKTDAPRPAAADASMPKERKAKLVRDSFTMPEQEYAVLGQVKKACIKAGFEIKKSELLRIGVALISQIDMATLQKVLADLPQLKTGRPKNE